MNILKRIREWAAKNALQREINYIQGGLFHFKVENGTAWLFCADKAICKMPLDCKVSEVEEKIKQMEAIATEYEKIRYEVK